MSDSSTNMKEEPPRRARDIYAVVVSYHPDDELVENVRLIAQQVGRVIVVDNGSGSPSEAILERVAQLENTELIRNKENQGIAGGLNTGIRPALAAGYEWIATFDQDSRVPKDFFSNLIRAMEAYPRTEQIGMLAPLCWSSEPAAPTCDAESAEAYKIIPSAISSGSMVRAEVFKRLGLFDEALFIDYVDVEFCLRLTKSGFKILGAPHAALRHELGSSQSISLFGKKLLSFRVHSAWRYYYIMRNRVLMFKKHGMFFPGWMLADGTGMFLELARIICLEKERVTKTHCALIGLLDGLRGRTGRNPKWP